ncbi:Glucagon-like peptide 1 receptor [Galemys pyrenaicus]|uniref:Glucagon-like peptide 1 receptor n=1 Tax=Galemys pyrenaicus TaxID=202257 RepID=A0A8J5ZYT9_GALPY|nr:Glucagon-like peptide 1 receptor [Galemys pyrenaicus]
MAGAPGPLRLALLLLGAVGRAGPRPQGRSEETMNETQHPLPCLSLPGNINPETFAEQLVRSYLCPCLAEGAAVSLSETVQRWREYRRQCQDFLTEEPPPATGLFCNRTFDDYACWPDGLPGSFVNVSCPWYLPWASSVLQGHVYRFCTAEGLWLHKDNSSLPWRDLSECEESKRGERDSPEEQLLSLHIIYTVGYALSFSALVIASAILLGFRHLHCTRNYIHLNLFASFILRALSVFIKDAALKWMYSTAAQQHQWDGLLSYQDSLGCRLVFLLMQYCVAANYYWLLVEGVYLYTLLAFSVFSEQRIFRLYLSIGWGVPLLFVIPWGIVKYLFEDEGLAKSTLTLIPLLGTHEVIFAFVMDEHARGTLRFIKLFTELSFTSFQGLMVAILYCFVNNEVQMEFRKSWERWRLEHLHIQRDSSMKPLQCPTSSVYAATCQASCG